MKLKEYVKQYITAQIKRHSIPIENQSYIDTWAERITNAARETGANDNLIRESLNDQCRILISGGTIKIDKTGTKLKEVGAAIVSNEPRPVTQLRRIMSIMPNLSNLINAVFAMRPQTPAHDWPTWCFIPRKLWMAMYVETYGYEQAVTPEGEHNMTDMMTIGTWRYSQGIYEFAPEIYEALIESEMSGQLPSNIFLHLPEWCIYVVTPNLNFYDKKMFGFYAMIDVDIDSNGHTAGAMLIISADCEDGLAITPIPLGKGTLQDALTDFANRAPDDMKDVAMKIAQKNIEDLTPIISLLMYLCSDAPEIDHSRTPGLSPFRAHAKTIKGKIKMFPAPTPQIWTVGAASAEKLRGLGYGGGSREGHRKRPHLRRGHWHGFWTGPRSGNRTFNYKWLPPMIVAVGND